MSRSTTIQNHRQDYSFVFSNAYLFRQQTRMSIIIKQNNLEHMLRAFSIMNRTICCMKYRGNGMSQLIHRFGCDLDGLDYFPGRRSRFPFLHSGRTGSEPQQIPQSMCNLDAFPGGGFKDVMLTTLFRLVLDKDWLSSISALLYVIFTQKKLHGLSPRANYTDRGTAGCRRSDYQHLRIEGATWSAWRIPTAVFSIF
jgi:hypothetical protein